MIYTATKMKHQISQAAQTTEHVIILMVPLSKNLPLPPVQHYGLGIVIYIQIRFKFLSNIIYLGQGLTN